MSRGIFENHELVFFDGAMGTMLQEKAGTIPNRRKFATWSGLIWWRKYMQNMRRRR